MLRYLSVACHTVAGCSAQLAVDIAPTRTDMAYLLADLLTPATSSEVISSRGPPGGPPPPPPPPSRPPPPPPLGTHPQLRPVSGDPPLTPAAPWTCWPRRPPSAPSRYRHSAAPGPSPSSPHYVPFWSPATLPTPPEVPVHPGLDLPELRVAATSPARDMRPYLSMPPWPAPSPAPSAAPGPRRTSTPAPPFILKPPPARPKKLTRPVPPPLPPRPPPPPPPSQPPPDLTPPPSQASSMASSPERWFDALSEAPPPAWSSAAVSSREQAEEAASETSLLLLAPPATPTPLEPLVEVAATPLLQPPAPFQTKGHVTFSQDDTHIPAAPPPSGLCMSYLD